MRCCCQTTVLREDASLHRTFDENLLLAHKLSFSRAQDAGHDVHQVSDEQKAAVPQHIKDAAQAMGREAFLARLKEIAMSEYDAKVSHRCLEKQKKKKKS
jgi:hypothetical protein